jgi:hypothetical protein
MKKGVFYLFILFIVLFGLCCCGGGGGGSSSSADETVYTDEIVEDDEEYTDVGDTGYDPQVAMIDGTAIVVWTQENDGGDGEILAKRYNGSSWEATATISSTSGASSPQIAADSSGDAFSVWVQDSDGIWANNYDDGIWGTAERISTDTDGIMASAPQIAFNDSGDAVAVWVRGGGSENGVWANYYDFDGIGWGTAEQISDGNVVSSYPRVTFDGRDNVIAVWMQDDDDDDDDDDDFDAIHANYYTSGVWDVDSTQIDNDVRSVNHPQLASDGAGNAIAVWQEIDTTDSNHCDIYSSYYTAATGWDADATLITASDNGAATYPDVAFDNAGVAISVWIQSSSNILVSRYSTGTWSSSETIDDSSGTTYTPRVATDDSGNAAVIWEQISSGIHHIWANAYDGSSWGEAAQIENNSGNAYNPQGDMDGDGNAIAVWDQTDDDDIRKIWTNLFE